jgi:2-methylcitrate dehydratase PrpD
MLTYTQQLVSIITSLKGNAFSSVSLRNARNVMIDTIGCAVAAHDTDYVKSLHKVWAQPGSSAIWGQNKSLNLYDAAMINGVAAHGEDFDSTYEGCPVHTGVVIVPALLALGQDINASGNRVLRSMIVGHEIMCRLGDLAGTSIHKRGFHPTAILGTISSAIASGYLLKLNERQLSHAIGISGSMTSGIIEYLADGSWTKRMHAGWAAQNGIRAARMAQANFTGPVSAIDGQHGIFNGFSSGSDQNYASLIEKLGTDWKSDRIALKAYASGTMTHPFIDCAISVANKIDIKAIKSIKCEVGEGTVHRLWEPLELKQTPPNSYSAKFSTPFCIALAMYFKDVGLNVFSEANINNPSIIALAKKVTYTVNPSDPYPKSYQGKITVTLDDGTKIVEFKPYLKGGSSEPLSEEAIKIKFFNNCAMHSDNYGDQTWKMLISFHGLEHIKYITL